MMNKKLSTILLTLALIAAILSACYPVTGNGGYRTMAVGSGTAVPTEPASEIGSEPETPEIEQTTSSPEQTTEALGTENETTASGPSQTDPPDTTEEETTAPVIISYDFDVLSAVSEIGSVGGKVCTATVRYPALKGLEDTEKQNDINELLSQIAAVEYQNRLPNAAELIKTGTAVNYEITATAVTYLGSNLLSVRSEGKIDYSDDSRDERFVYCNLIKLSTGKDITLKKTFSDFDKIISLFNSGKFTQISGEPSLSSSAILSQLMEQYKYHSQYGTYPETYFTPQQMVLVIETNRENGFFGEFSIDISQVNDCLQNKIS